MMTTRRTFLKTIAAVSAAAGLPRFVAGASADRAPFPAPPNFFTSRSVSALVTGGTISKDGRLLPAVSAAHKLHYGTQKNILLILHASIPADRDGAEKKVRSLLAADGYAAESLHHYEGRAALKKIEEAEAFFVGGGDTFLLLRTLYDTGQFALLRKKVLAGARFNGSSAGCNIAGLNIGGTNDFPVVDVPTKAALGFFPCVFNPHHPVVGEPEYEARVRKIRGYRRINPAEIVLGVGNGSAVRLHAGKVTVEAKPAFLYAGETVRELPLGEVPELTKLVG
ncbi:MAG: Type 1 glutamine amidotransferase-like domain-containing protein [Undibacterium sp.]|nr:Type 1 glutamine amidotransferase-like domain-containing protein [Opitutaceae bacterium]